MLGPFALLFFLPLAFYRIPLHVTLFNRAAEVPGHVVAQALAAAVVWIGMVVAIIVWPQRRVVQTSWPWTSRLLWRSFLVLSVAGSAVATLHALWVMPPDLEEVAHVAAFAPTLGFVLGLAVWPVTPSTAARMAILGLLLLDLVTAILIPILLSKLTPAILSMLAIAYGVGIMRLSVRSKIVLGAALAALLVPILLAAFPLKALLRETVYSGPFVRPLVGGDIVLSPNTIPQTVLKAKQHAAAFPQNFDLWQYGLRFHRVDHLPGFWQYAIWRAVVRTDRLSDLAYVVEKTPAAVPYTHGATYFPLPYKLIPRMLWPHRPAEDTGKFYAYRYALDLSTNASYNLPIVTEGWMSAGWLGVTLSAAFVGALLRVMWQYGIGDSGAAGNVLVGMAVIGTAADVESNLSLVIGGVIHAFVFYAAIAFAVHLLGARTDTSPGAQGMSIESS